MPADKFGRYVWLIDIIRSHPNITFEEISEYWINSALGDGEPLPWRTFMNHKKKIETIFDVIIECGKGYRYRIAEVEQLKGDDFRTWLIDSYSVLNQVSADKKLLGRISFENIPSGQDLLQTFLQAMRHNNVVQIEYQSFSRDNPSVFEIEPYHMKVFNRRWYVIARSTYYNKILTYGLDRIHWAKITDKSFEIPASFNIDEYFDGCVGIIGNIEDCKVERVVIKVYGYSQKYLQTLPIHPSQTVIGSDEESTTFELHVRPTYDLLTTLLQQADQIEVHEPQSVRKLIRDIGNNIARNNE